MKPVETNRLGKEKLTIQHLFRRTAMSTILNLFVGFVLAAPVALSSPGTDYHTQRDAIDTVSQELRNAKVSGDIDRVTECTIRLCDLQTKIGRPGAALNTLRFSQRWIDNRVKESDTTPSAVIEAEVSSNVVFKDF
jgi:hypothetical protein